MQARGPPRHKPEKKKVREYTWRHVSANDAKDMQDDGSPAPGNAPIDVCEKEFNDKSVIKIIFRGQPTYKSDYDMHYPETIRHSGLQLLYAPLRGYDF